MLKGTWIVPSLGVLEHSRACLLVHISTHFKNIYLGVELLGHSIEVNICMHVCVGVCNLSRNG